MAGEISSVINGEMFGELDSATLRVGLPDIPAPCSRTLEEFITQITEPSVRHQKLHV